MNIAQKILQLVHPKAEQERMTMRKEMARAQAEAEHLTRSLSMSHEDFCEMMRREGECPEIKENKAQK